MTIQHITYQAADAGGIATIMLNRPDKLNALTLQMLDDLEAALATIDAAPDCRVLLLTAAGEKAFCAGADIRAWADFSPLEMWQRWIRRGHQVFDRLAALRQPSIAVLPGIAFGGGLELALACDLRLATTSTRLALPETTLGTIPGWAGSQRLPQLIGMGRAKQMVFTGEPIEATTALSWGLLNATWPQQELALQAQSLAQRIAANAPIAVQTSKQLLDGSAGIGLSVTLESLASAVNASTDDLITGLDAFKARKKPQFSGK